MNTLVKMILFSLSVCSISHATLIENGSSFTGKYQVQEATCRKTVFNVLTGNHDLVDIFNFEGTPEGLNVDGRLQQLESGNPQAALPDSGVTTNSAYLSSHEFRVEGVLHFERDGAIPPVTAFMQDYQVDNAGNLTSVSINTNGVPADNLTCHFIRLN